MFLFVDHNYSILYFKCQSVRTNVTVIYYQPFPWRCFPEALDAEHWGSLGVKFQF